MKTGKSTGILWKLHRMYSIVKIKIRWENRENFHRPFLLVFNNKHVFFFPRRHFAKYRKNVFGMSLKETVKYEIKTYYLKWWLTFAKIMENPICTFQCHSTEKFKKYCNRNTGNKGENTHKIKGCRIYLNLVSCSRTYAFQSCLLVFLTWKIMRIRGYRIVQKLTSFHWVE